MKKVLLFLSLAATVAVTGCTHSVHQSHMGDFLPRQQKGARFISVESQRKVIFGFIFDTDFVEDAKHKLLAACPRNEITGVNTQYITSHGFLSWTEKIRIKALCLD